MLVPVSRGAGAGLARGAGAPCPAPPARGTGACDTAGARRGSPGGTVIRNVYGTVDPSPKVTSIDRVSSPEKSGRAV
ncbi:hypothetical protein [Methylobacterium sp. C1]|uniref:hypothetical protein n=1 Tax=Methylobacterium sp. C1 TaxID=1479019 RepID=UPI0008D95EC2|nr:hypothetical protein [Methylobacterium sp. C1]